MSDADLLAKLNAIITAGGAGRVLRFTVHEYDQSIELFIDPALPAGPQLIVMCVATTLMAGTTDTAWAVASGLGRAWFMKPQRARLLARLSGTVLIGGGVWLSLARRPA